METTAKRSTPPLTEYQLAWQKYTSSDSFIASHKVMINQYGIKDPYTTNILQSAFTAGWNMSKSNQK